MSIMNALSVEDVAKFEYFAVYYNNTVAPKYLDTAWAPHKEDLYKLFGEQLIISFPIEYDLDKTILEEEFLNKFNRNESVKLMHNEIKEMLQYILFKDFPFVKEKTYFDLTNLYFKFLDKNECTALSKEEITFMESYRFFNFFVTHFISNSSYYQTYYKNTVKCYERDIFSLDRLERLTAYINNNQVKLTITNNEKPFKFLIRTAKKCLQYLTEEEVDRLIVKDLLIHIEKARILQSQLLNTKSLKGNLNLSIHPLDYITMSDNEYGWSSCMSWEENGCYKLGTLEMLSSPKVIVAYLTGENNEYHLTSDITWNNKKWRELFVVDKNVISGVRGYPYYNKTLESAVLNKLVELATNNLGWEFEKDTIEFLTNSYSPETNEKTYSIRMHTNAMYNDFGVQSPQAYLGINTREILKENPINIYYGDYPYCLNCGEPIYLQNDSEYDTLGDGLECLNCRGLYHCDECGMICDADDIYDFNGKLLCPCCYEENYTYCKECDNYISIEDCITFTTFACNPRTEKIHEFHITIHEDCLNNYLKENQNIYDFTFGKIAFPLNESVFIEKLSQANPQLKGITDITDNWWYFTGLNYYNVIDLNNACMYDQIIIDAFEIPYDYIPISIPKEWINFYEN